MTDEMDELSSIEEQLEAAEQEEAVDEESEPPEAELGEVGEEPEKSEAKSGDVSTVDSETTSKTGREEYDSKVADDSSRPFTHEETDMVGMYVREETERAWKDAKNAAGAAVSKQTDADDVAASEFQDAALRLVAKHPSELAKLVLEERGIDVDEERVREIVELLQE
jgi:hypothetical protein